MMMSLMSKLLSTTLLATLSLSAASTEADVKDYVKNHLIKNKSVKVKSVDIIEKKSIKELKGWDIYFININAEVKKTPTITDVVTVPETIFVKDGIATNALIDMKTGRDFHMTLKPKLKDSVYNEKHRIAGNKDAKHKIVIFSDPQCPFCQTKVPEIYKDVKANPETFALYYYHFPLLRIHPVADIITRAMLVEQNKKNFDKVIEMYSLKIDPREVNLTKVLDKLNKKFDLTLTEKQVDAKEIEEELKHDQDVATRSMVSGTPTVFLDSVWDKSRSEYKKLIPEDKKK